MLKNSKSKLFQIAQFILAIIVVLNFAFSTSTVKASVSTDTNPCGPDLSAGEIRFFQSNCSFGGDVSVSLDGKIWVDNFHSVDGQGAVTTLTQSMWVKARNSAGVSSRPLYDIGLEMLADGCEDPFGCNSAKTFTDDKPGLVLYDVPITPYYTILYGTVRDEMGNYAAYGSLIQFVTPAGVIAGQTMVRENGAILFEHVYGADDITSGFNNGDVISVRIDDQPANLTPNIFWENDLNIHEVEISPAKDEIKVKFDEDRLRLRLTIDFEIVKGPAWVTLQDGEGVEIPIVFRDDPVKDQQIFLHDTHGIEFVYNTVTFTKGIVYTVRIRPGNYQEGPDWNKKSASASGYWPSSQIFLPIIVR